MMAVSVHLCIYEIAPTSPVLDRTRHGIPQPLTDSRPLTPPTPLPSLSPLPTQRQIKSDFDWPGLAWTALGAGLDWTGLDRVERDDGKMMERAVGDAALSGCRTCGTSPSPRALLIPIYVLSYVREHQADDETQGFIRTVDIAGG